MEKITFFAVNQGTELKPVVKRIMLFNGETRFELINSEVLVLPIDTELIALEETSDSIKTVGTLLHLLSAQMVNNKSQEVVLSSTFIPAFNAQHFLREDVETNEFDESIKVVK